MDPKDTLFLRGAGCCLCENSPAYEISDGSYSKKNKGLGFCYACFSKFGCSYGAVDKEINRRRDLVEERVSAGEDLVFKSISSASSSLTFKVISSDSGIPTSEELFRQRRRKELKRTQQVQALDLLSHPSGVKPRY